LHQGRDRYQSVEDGKAARYECCRFKRTGAKNTSATIAEILDAAIELLGRLGAGGIGGGLMGKQAPGMYVQHVLVTLMAAAFSMREVSHDTESCPKRRLP
jgi:hypothetical protein